MLAYNNTGIKMRFAVILAVGAILMGASIDTTRAAATDADAPGAAALWTSDHPTIVHARELIGRGSFAQAEKLLRDEMALLRGTKGSTASNADVEIDHDGQRIFEESLETIRRVRREFNQTEAELVTAIRKSIEDFTAEELRRLVDEGEVTSRMIDGQLCYYRREPGVMLRFSDEIKHRRAEWDEKRRAANPSAFVKTGRGFGRPRRSRAARPANSSHNSCAFMPQSSCKTPRNLATCR